MIYYKIIGWSKCPWCDKAKTELIKRSKQFEYCLVGESRGLLNHYKSIYKQETVPMVIQINTSTGHERFIGGYTDLIKHLERQLIERKVPDPDGEG